MSEHADNGGAESGRTRTERLIDEAVDEVLPGEVDWEHLVRSYPLPALAVAAAAGFWVGIRHGSAVVAAASAFAASKATDGVRRVFSDLDLDLGDLDAD